MAKVEPVDDTSSDFSSREFNGASEMGLTSRRSLGVVPVAAAAVALLASARDVKADTPVPKNPVQLKAPKDATVTGVSSRIGVQLNEGDLICDLDTTSEDQMIARINAAKQLVQLDQASMSTAKIAQRRDILQQSVTVATAYQKFALTRYTRQAYELPLGLIDATTVDQSQAALTRADAELDKANASLILFDDNVSQTNARLVVLSTQLDVELQNIQDKKSNSSIRMPFAGIIVNIISQNMFVEKGDILATIQPT